jgi:hypothetical protein
VLASRLLECAIALLCLLDPDSYSMASDVERGTPAGSLYQHLAYRGRSASRTTAAAANAAGAAERLRQALASARCMRRLTDEDITVTTGETASVSDDEQQQRRLRACPNDFLPHKAASTGAATAANTQRDIGLLVARLAVEAKEAAKASAEWMAQELSAAVHHVAYLGWEQ